MKKELKNKIYIEEPPKYNWQYFDCLLLIFPAHFFFFFLKLNTFFKPTFGS